MDDSDADQRLPHKTDPVQEVLRRKREGQRRKDGVCVKLRERDSVCVCVCSCV